MISMGVAPVRGDCDSHAQEGQRTHIHGLPSHEPSSVPAQPALTPGQTHHTLNYAALRYYGT